MPYPNSDALAMREFASMEVTDVNGITVDVILSDTYLVSFDNCEHWWLTPDATQFDDDGSVYGFNASGGHVWINHTTLLDITESLYAFCD